MLKKLTLLAMSVGALLAFAAPAAQATGPLITDSAGGTPTYVTAVSTNTITHTVAGTLECTTVDLTLHLTHNNNTTASGHGKGTAEGTPKETATHSGHCAVSSGAIAEITDVTVSSISLKAEGGETKGTAAFSFTYDLRSATGAGLIAECTFATAAEKPVAVKKTGANTMNVLGEVVKTGGGAFCPGTGSLTGDFTLYDHGSFVDKGTIH